MQPYLRNPFAYACVLIMVAASAHAQGTTSRIDQVSDSFRISVEGISEKLSTIAEGILMSLLLIELIWSLGKAVMKQSDFAKLFGTFIKRVVVAGFFLAIIDGIPTASGNVGIGTFIIQSAEALVAESVTTASVKPSDLFWQMLHAGRDIYDRSSGITSIITAAIVWILMAVIGAIIVGLMLVTYIEIYVIFTVGILALGFGVWTVTEQFAKNFLFSAVGKILKLFTMILMASIVAFSVQSFGNISTFEEGLITIGILIIIAMLMSSVPQAVEQIISGIPAVSADQSVAGTVSGAAKGGAKAVGRGAAAPVKVLGGMAGDKLKAGGKALKSGAADRIRNIMKG
mgnify:CR=1 FL=1